LANGQSKWITGEAARADVQRWRARSSAIVTGVGTVLADDPQMTVRLPDETPFVAPLRVVVDTYSRAPHTARIFDRSAPTLIYCAQMQNDRYPVEVAQQTLGIDPIGRLDLTAMLEDLAWHGANEVQVEAGANLSGALLQANLVDELLLYIAPCLLGDRGRPLLILPELTQMTGRSRWQLLDQRQIGEDIRLLLRPRRDKETA
jgi:diaminohydroxyphosphoribosylaminopyrimidine deaminase / 5-amino-6-(5-phosphoribosylamino)uracil reductase